MEQPHVPVEGGPRVAARLRARAALDLRRLLALRERLQRAGGARPLGAPGAVGWETPRFFQNTNMFAQLPAELDNRGKSDTHLRLWVSDDLTAEAERIRDITLHMILHDGAAGEHVEILNSSEKPAPPDEERIERALVTLFRDINHLYNCPPVNGIEKRVEVRVNNVLLAEPSVEDGWLVFHNVDPVSFAVGSNLVGVLVKPASPGQEEPLLIEKLELHVKYGDDR